MAMPDHSGHRERTLLQNAFELFQYGFLAIASLFILELIYPFAVFHPLLIGLFSALKVYLYSALLGVFIEMISSQELFFSPGNLHRNARQLWLMVLAANLLRYGVAIFLGAVIPFAGYPFVLAFVQHSQIPVLFLLAQWIIGRKYLKPQGLKRRKIPLRGDAIAVIAAFFILDLTVFYIPKIMPWGETYWPILLGFLAHCLFFAEFIYLSHIIIGQYPEVTKSFEAEKEIYFVDPLSGGVTKALASVFCRVTSPPFVVLKALTPASYRFKKFIKRFWQDRYYRPGKLVAVTCYTSNCYEAYKIAKEFKRRGSKVIMGGPHVMYLPDEALAFCDSVVIGEAEGVWKEIVQDYEKDTLKPKYFAVNAADFHGAVHQELMQSSPDVIKEFIEPTRGCKFRCHFCTIPLITGGNVRKKPVGEIVELIKRAQPKYQYISFLDNNIYNDPAYAKELFKAVKPLGIKWQSFCTIDIAKNEELLRLAKESGCFMLIFGYEIFGGSQEDRKGGKLAMADRYLQYSRVINRHGIHIKGNFIFGWDSDNLKSFFQLWKFSFTLRPLLASVGLLTPFPGSQLYYDMVRENRIRNLNWRQYDALDLVIHHRQLNNTVVSAVFFPFVPLLFFLTSQIGWFSFALFILIVILTQWARLAMG